MYMITKKQFESHFKKEYLPAIKEIYEEDGRIDYPARREAWNNLIDMLVENRELPGKAIDWTCPW